MNDDQSTAPKVVLALEYKKIPELDEKPPSSPPFPEPTKVEMIDSETPVSEPPDLLVIFSPYFYLVSSWTFRVYRLKALLLLMMFSGIT